MIERLDEALSGRYTVEREVGAGGMATVFLAEDLRHERKVALKVLKPELAAVIGAERFVAEIKTTAALQHPHILPLFDSGEADGFLYYVMPFIEGETLRDRLDREKQLGVDEAVELTVAVADALHYAHRQGVIHRDIKPANILLHDGRPVVSDFGIAVAVSAAGGGRLTETGLSLGTPHYMSPEQATADRDLSPRSDVYSLGGVLYEMLTGDPPHQASTAQAVLVRILTEVPRSVTDVRSAVPPNVSAAVGKALEKLPADRFTTAAEFAEALEDEHFRHRRTSAQPALVAAAPVPGDAATGAKPSRATGVLAGTAVLLAGLAAWGWLRPVSSEGPLTTVRMAFPDSQAPVTGVAPSMDLSPDGRSLVYVGPSPGGRMLWYRELDRLDARPLPGTENALTPIFSPDGRSVAYTTGFPGDLRIVELDGGAPVTILQNTAFGWGISWSDDGWIYTTDDTSIRRVRAQGGTVEPVTQPDQANGETWRGWPHVLPGGRHLLFQNWKGSLEAAEVGLVDLESGEEAILAGGIFPLWATTGHLVFTRGGDGTLMAAPLDLDGLSLGAEPSAIFGGVATRAEGFAEVALSEAGTMVFILGAVTGAELVWVGRDGSQETVDSTFTGDFQGISLSPDGSRVAAGVVTQEGQNVYVHDLAGGPWRRVTFADGRVDRPQWRSNGTEVSYISNMGRAGGTETDIWTARADGTGESALTLDLEAEIQEVTWSPDGEWLVYRVGPEGETRRDLYAIDGGGTGDTLEIAATNFDEHSPTLSPDGRWLAYVSDESGRVEVFVRPFPDVEGGKWQVSDRGGIEPVWGRTGREIFYRTPGSGTMWAARYVTEPSFAVVDRTDLFPAHVYDSDPVHQSYDVDLDDQRFLMARNQGSAGDVVLVENWFRQLRERLGGGEGR